MSSLYSFGHVDIVSAAAVRSSDAVEALPWLVQSLWTAYCKSDKDRQKECITALFECVGEITGRKVGPRPGDPSIEEKDGLRALLGLTDANEFKVGDRVKVKNGLLGVYRGAVPFQPMLDCEGLRGTVVGVFGGLAFVNLGPDRPVWPWHSTALIKDAEARPDRWRDIVDDVCPRKPKPEQPHEMHAAVCDMCRAECQVPFQPDGVRAVFCRTCYRKRPRTGRTTKSGTEAFTLKLAIEPEDNDIDFG